MKCMQIKKNISIQDESTIINEEITTYNFDMKEIQNFHYQCLKMLD